MTAAPTSSNIDGSNDIASLRRENLQLKQSLAKLQNHYEELQDDSKFHQAKVNELSDILMQRARKEGQGGALEGALIAKSTEVADLKIQIDNLHTQLTKANNEVQTLKLEKQGNNKLLLELSDIVRTLSSVQISYNTTANESSDGTSTLSAQHASIQNVKRKIESIMSDRALLVRRCKELEEETSQQHDKIKALEGQFHLVNSMNFIQKKAAAGGGSDSPSDHSKTASLSSSSESSSVSSSSELSSPRRGIQHHVDGDVNRLPVSYSSASDGIHRRHMSRPHRKLPSSVKSQGMKTDRHHSNDDISVDNDSMSSGVSLIERQVFEDRLRIQEQRHNEAVQQLCEEHEEQLEKAQADYNDISKQLQAVKAKMVSMKEKMEDAIISRDEFKGSLRDIISQYKDLHKQNTEATERIRLLEERIQSLQTEMARREEQWAKQQAQESGIKVDKKWMPWTPKEDVQDDADEASILVEDEKGAVADECTTIASSSTSPVREREQISSSNDATMEDLLTAYAIAMEKIEILEAGDAVSRCNKLEKELEDYKRKLSEMHKLSGGKRESLEICDVTSRNHKLEQELQDYKQKLSKTEAEAETARKEALKERQEANHVRRRLTAYIQKEKKEQKDSDSTGNNCVAACNSKGAVTAASVFGCQLKHRAQPKAVAGPKLKSTAGANFELKALLQKREALISAKERIEKEDEEERNTGDETSEETVQSFESESKPSDV